MRKIAVLLVLLIGTGTYVVKAGVSQTIESIMADLQEYTGTYKVSGDLPFDKIMVSEKEGKLHYVAGEYVGFFAAVDGKADTYTSGNGEGIITFVRNETGKITKLKLEVQGDVFEAAKEVMEMAASSSTLTDYVGTYKFEGLPFEKLVFSVRDNQLHVVAGDNEGILTPLANQADAFDANGQAIVKFKRDNMKKVTGIVLEAQGQIFEGTPVTE